jgi:hypothetical protein
MILKKEHIVLAISISNLRLVWNLMLGIWDFKDSVNAYKFGCQVNPKTLS